MHIEPKMWLIIEIQTLQSQFQCSVSLQCLSCMVAKAYGCKIRMGEEQGNRQGIGVHGAYYDYDTDSWTSF